MKTSALITWPKKGANAAQTFEYTLSHILFTPKTGGDDAAQGRAKAVAEKLKGGQSFEKLAEQFSEDANFTKGGALGTFRAGEMIKEIEDAVRKLSGGNQRHRQDGARLSNNKSRKAHPNLRSQIEEEKRKYPAHALRGRLQAPISYVVGQRRDESFIRINGL